MGWFSMDFLGKRQGLTQGEDPEVQNRPPLKKLIPFSKIMVIQLKSRFTTVVTVVIKHRSLNGNSPS